MGHSAIPVTTDTVLSVANPTQTPRHCFSLRTGFATSARATACTCKQRQRTCRQHSDLVELGSGAADDSRPGFLLWGVCPRTQRTQHHGNELRVDGDCVIGMGQLRVQSCFC